VKIGSHPKFIDFFILIVSNYKLRFSRKGGEPMKRLLGIAVITALIVGFSLNVSAAGDLNDTAMGVELFGKSKGDNDLGSMD
ncbi:hypothetical protein, partial [Piscibacillus halophilus]|uniref:hypothetical protein n=1 Tax=Piscibacillus halophilus TaxID=571933 RepID=UPI001C37AE04